MENVVYVVVGLLAILLGIAVGRWIGRRVPAVGWGIITSSALLIPMLVFLDMRPGQDYGGLVLWLPVMVLYFILLLSVLTTPLCFITFWAIGSHRRGLRRRFLFAPVAVAGWAIAAYACIALPIAEGAFSKCL